MTVARFWREIPTRYNFIGTKCNKCENLMFPPREICPKCLHHDLSTHQFIGKGEIVTHTTIHVGQEGYEKQTPYVIAIIELDQGPRITAQIVDCDPKEVEIGKKVESVFRKIMSDGATGAISYGYKFKLV